MAFAQQQRRPTNRFLNTSSYEECSDNNNNSLLQYTHSRSQQTVSDSDNDWHVISSAPPSSASPSSAQSSSTSPVLLPSETESYASHRIISDTEESDMDQVQSTIAFLPSHDGTGTFFVEDSSDQLTGTSNQASDDEDSVDSQTAFTRAVHGLLLDHTEDELEIEDKRVLDITLPHGGIQPPSFIPVEPPGFTPTTAGLGSQELLINGAQSGETVDNNLFLSDEGGVTTSPHIKFTTKRQRNLDRIPIHHPSIPGSSSSVAFLSIVWNSLRRLTNHLIENDTNTVETLSTLMSEAVFEGCMPFGTHLHMDLDNGIRSTTASSLFEGHIAI